VHVVHEIVALAAHAAALTDLIERVGSYAGFAAVVGLAVLSALYFSQARDVRRLREWAGRAPERAAELQHGGRTAQATAVRTGQPAGGNVGAAQPVRQPGTAQPVAGGTQQHGLPARPATAPVTAGTGPGTAVRPGAAPATAAVGNAAAAAASAAGATPATASAAGAATPGKPGGGPAAATGPAAAPARPGAPATGAPAGSAAPGAPATGVPARAGTAAPGARPGIPAQGTTAARAGTAPGARAGATTAPARGNTGTGAKVLPARPAQPQRPRPIPAVAGRSGQTAVIPPPRKDRRWTAPRYLALIVAGVIVLGLGGAVGFLALTGNDNGSKKRASSVALPKGGGTTPGKAKPRKSTAPPVDPATVTVAVLNGTQVTGLAGTTGQKVSAAGFRLGNVATASQAAPRAESVVLYRPGSSREARAVARKLGISQIEPIDSTSETLAGTATVVVVVGADRAGD
jgi:hypothetical protein